MSDELTLANFREKTGYRFRVNEEQKQKIKDGQLTREQAFQEWLVNGGVANLKPRKPEIPTSVYLTEGLTVENFSERVKEATGVSRRFRMNREQCARFDEGKLTREQALQEVIAAMKVTAQ
jgi:hypothetical protein